MSKEARQYDKVVAVSEQDKPPNKSTWLVGKGDFAELKKLLAMFARFQLTSALLITVELYTTSKKERYVRQCQSRLMWKWHGEWCKHYGDLEKLRAHRNFKKHYLLPILLEDDPWLDKQWVYAQTLGDKGEGKESFLKHIHHLDVSPKALAEAMKLYEMWAAQQGCLFTKPAYRWQALMEEQGQLHAT